MAKAPVETPEKEVEAKAPEQAEAQTPQEAKAPAKRRKARRTVSEGQIHVLASFNNTIITVTDNKGNTIASASAGASGFRGSKKGTAYASQVATEKAVGLAKQNFGLTKAGQKIHIENIKDITGIPHGGVRPRKPKRN
jgi:small subunit ribosomal protein S11